MLFCSLPPSQPIRGKSFPCEVIDTHSFEVYSAHVFTAQLWSACWTFSLCQFFIKQVFGDPAIVHFFTLSPNQRTHLCFNRVNMLGIPVLSRTLLFITLSCQVMCIGASVYGRCLVSFPQCRARRVQDSLPLAYKRVLRTQAVSSAKRKSRGHFSRTLDFALSLGRLKSFMSNLVLR